MCSWTAAEIMYMSITILPWIPCLLSMSHLSPRSVMHWEMQALEDQLHHLRILQWIVLPPSLDLPIQKLFFLHPKRRVNENIEHFKQDNIKAMYAWSDKQVIAEQNYEVTWSLGSFVIGLLQRSIVFALDFVALPHHDSHHNHSWGSEKMGTLCWA